MAEALEMAMWKEHRRMKSKQDKNTETDNDNDTKYFKWVLIWCQQTVITHFEIKHREGIVT